jgi:S1-C subfamily serine protease
MVKYPVDPNYYKGYYKMEIDYLTTPAPVSQGGLGGTIVDIGNDLWKVIW